MKQLNAWVVWLIVAALVQLAQVTIGTAEAIHSSHYDGHSVLVGVLICTGVETILTAIFAFLAAVEW